jgi:hypothetical protein
MKWVKLCKYCEMTGETRDSVHQKRAKGVFIDGIHCKIADDRKLWINTEAVELWVEQGQKAALSRLRVA